MFTLTGATVTNLNVLNVLGGRLTLNSGATLTLNSQQAVGTAIVEVDSGLLDHNFGATINGSMTTGA